MFFLVLAGIILLSLRNGGAFDTVCPPPLSASGGGGQLPPLAPGSAAYRLMMNITKSSDGSGQVPVHCVIAVWPSFLFGRTDRVFQH